MKINSSIFSKTIQILRGEAIESGTFTNPFTTWGGDIGKGFRSGFKLLCITFLSKLESRRCKPVCYNGKYCNLCSQFSVTSSWTYKFSRKKNSFILTPLLIISG